MSQSIDLLTCVAKFLKTHDNLVTVSAETYHLPIDHLQRLGFVTRKMCTNVECLNVDPSLILKAHKRDVYDIASSYHDPSRLAAVILDKDPVDVIHAIRGLMCNQAWDEKDDLFIAICLLSYTLDGPYDASDDFETNRFKDEDVMRRICRYDGVMRSYSSFNRDNLVDFSGYMHGRSHTAMFLLMIGNDKHLTQLAESMSLQDMLKFINEIPNDAAYVNTIMNMAYTLEDGGDIAFMHFMRK